MQDLLYTQARGFEPYTPKNPVNWPEKWEDRELSRMRILMESGFQPFAALYRLDVDDSIDIHRYTGDIPEADPFIVILEDVNGSTVIYVQNEADLLALRLRLVPMACLSYLQDVHLRLCSGN